MQTEDLIINFSLVLKRLEDGLYLDTELLKNSKLKCFWSSILYYRINAW